MNAPDRFEADHRRYHSALDLADRLAPTEEDIERAQETVADLLIEGRTVAGWTMAAVLDCEANERGFASDLAEVLNVWADSGSSASLWLRVQAYLRKLVVKHVPADVFEERAAQDREDA